MSNWFQKLCRNTGLMVHHLTKMPDSGTKKKEVNRQVEEKQVDEKMILRRTTIDEVEYRKGDDE